jgi:hypothetical protein
MFHVDTFTGLSSANICISAVSGEPFDCTVPLGKVACWIVSSKMTLFQLWDESSRLYIS